jgi:argininosuccinate lyase
MPFRTAHDIVGKLVLYGIEQGKELGELSLDEMKQIAPEISEDVFASLGLEQTLASKSAIGGTSPERVREALDSAKTYLDS